MPRTKKTVAKTEKPAERTKTVKAKEVPVSTKKVIPKAVSASKKENEIVKEIRRQVKVLQNTMKSGKFNEEWDEVGDNYWFKFKGDVSEKHFIIKASMDKKPVYTLYGISPISEYFTVFDTVSIEKDTDEKITLKFTNKLGEFRHQLVF